LSARQPIAAPATHGLKNVCFRRGNEPTSGYHLDWMRCAERLSDADCDEIIAACHEFPITPPSTVGEERYPGHREADTRKVGVNSRTQWVFGMLCDVASEATRTTYGLDLTTMNRAPQYVEYRPGWGHFDCHNDYSHGVAEAPRKLTIIIQLSHGNEYEGGRLQIYSAEVEELPDERGTVIAFPSFVYHRVTPVTRGMRRALVAWVAGPRMR
jgi:PKHD-type hydroxylase